MYHRLSQISISAESFQQNLIDKYKENQRGTNSAELLSNCTRLPGGRPGDWRPYYRRQAKQTLPPACRADGPAIGAKQAAQFRNLRGCNRHDDRAMTAPGS